MWREALILAAAFGTPIDGYPNFSADLSHLLDRTIWVDIGVGRDIASLSPQERTTLKRCTEPTMGFRYVGNAWEQSFYAGIETRTAYTSAVVTNRAAGKTIAFYMAGSRAPAETIRLSTDGDVLIEQTPGFRPHTLLRCNLPEPAPRKR